MNVSAMLEKWRAEILHAVAAQTATVVGVFTLSGEPVYMNEGMSRILAGDPETNLTDRLKTPTFSRLRFWREQDSPSYQGQFNFSDLRNNYHSIRGVAWTKAEHILILAEHDIVELERTSQELVDLNKEVNTLQRTVAQEKRALEQTLAELRRTQAALIQSEKLNALGQLVAGVAHEINNPVAFVASNIFSLKEQMQDLFSAYHSLETLYCLQGSEPTAKAKEVREQADLDFLEDDALDLLTGSLEGLSRVKCIVEDLRNFSRLDEAEQQVFDLNENVDTTLALASPEIKKQRVTVVKELAPLPRIAGYPAQLNQVILNLLINGVQAMMEQDKRVLTVRTRVEEDAVVLEIGDTGSGIPPEVRAKIFDPFFTTKPVGSGTGLGLSVVHTVVTQRHQGTIDVASEVGRGSVFTVKIAKESERA